MKWLTQIKNMNHKQKHDLKMKLNAIYTHPIFHALAFVVFTFVSAGLWNMTN